MLGFFKKLFGGTPVNYKELLSNGAIIVDVRSAGEYKSGHIPGSRNLPLDGIRGKIQDLKKTNKPVITVCRSGARSKEGLDLNRNFPSQWRQEQYGQKHFKIGRN